MVDSILKHLRARFNEWVSSFALLMTGLLLLQPAIATIAIFVASLRIVMLLINGAWGLSPHFRTAGGILSSILWTIALTNSVFYPAVIAVIVMDLYSIWYSSSEAKASDIRRKKYENMFI